MTHCPTRQELQADAAELDGREQQDDALRCEPWNLCTRCGQQLDEHIQELRVWQEWQGLVWAA